MVKMRKAESFLSMVYILAISPRLFHGFEKDLCDVDSMQVYCVDRFRNGKNNDDNRTADSKFILKKHLRHRNCNYYSRYDFYVRNP